MLEGEVAGSVFFFVFSPLPIPLPSPCPFPALSAATAFEELAEREKESICKGLHPPRMARDSEFVSPVSFRTRMRVS